MAWRVAESLETLRKQLNAAFPKRSKASDGGIGDAKHASRNSDHNPWVKDGKTGIVTARDFTHDPKTGIDCQWLADTLVRNKDPRIKYIIWNRQICSSLTSPWKWRPYSGANAHTKHLHLSVNSEKKHYDSTKAWKLDFPKATTSDVAKIVEDDEPVSTAASITTTSGQDSARNSAIEPHSTNPPSNDLQPGSVDEVTAKKETETPGGSESIEITSKNELDVNVPAAVKAPEPYQGVGFWGVIKRDLGAATGGNLTFSGLAEYAQQASGWPPWVVGMLSKLAVGLLIATFGYFVFRVIHYLADTWKKNQKTKIEAEAATSTVRKDIEWQE